MAVVGWRSHDLKLKAKILGQLLQSIENSEIQQEERMTNWRSRWMNEEISNVDEPVVAFCINDSYENENNNNDVYRCTRGNWRVNLDHVKLAKYAFGVYHGVVLGVFKILNWQNAGDDPDGHGPQPGRYEFVGEPAPNRILTKYINKKLPGRFYGSLRYFNCDGHDGRGVKSGAGATTQNP